jgi:putative colanic acid biosynthesis UDP-glucose lipid carrier transferase
MSSLLKAIFFSLDLILLNSSILAVFYFDNNTFWLYERSDVVYLIIYSNLSWLFLVLVSTPYSVTKNWTISRIVRNQFAFLFIHLLVVMSLITFFNKNYTAIQILFIYLVFIFLFLFFRITIYYLRKLFITDLTERNFIIIGRNELSFEVRKYFLLNPETGYKFKGYIDFNEQGFPFIQIHQFCSANEVHEIYCCAPHVKNAELQQLINFGLDSMIKVKLIFNVDDTRGQSIQMEQYDKLPGIDMLSFAIDDPRSQLLKRIFDLIFSTFFSILILTWLIPIIALLIKLESKGPVFFIQQRNGEKNTPFGCIKFRTMFVNSESDLKQATKDDSRITRVGRFLRKSSIDELPQFINVLKGEMSLIGPRPHPIKLNEKFAPLIANIMSRHYVKPGITGLAQCMGYRGETKTLADMENRVRLDRYYIENWTFWLDIKIIFLTIVSLIRGSDKAF